MSYNDLNDFSFTALLNSSSDPYANIPLIEQSPTQYAYTSEQLNAHTGMPEGSVNECSFDDLPPQSGSTLPNLMPELAGPSYGMSSVDTHNQVNPFDDILATGLPSNSGYMPTQNVNIQNFGYPEQVSDGHELMPSWPHPQQSSSNFIQDHTSYIGSQGFDFSDQPQNTHLPFDSFNQVDAMPPTAPTNQYLDYQQPATYDLLGATQLAPTAYEFTAPVVDLAPPPLVRPHQSFNPNWPAPAPSSSSQTLEPLAPGSSRPSPTYASNAPSGTKRKEAPDSYEPRATKRALPGVPANPVHHAPRSTVSPHYRQHVYEYSNDPPRPVKTLRKEGRSRRRKASSPPSAISSNPSLAHLNSSASATPGPSNHSSSLSATSLPPGTQAGPITPPITPQLAAATVSASTSSQTTDRPPLSRYFRQPAAAEKLRPKMKHRDDFCQYCCPSRLLSCTTQIWDKCDKALLRVTGRTQNGFCSKDDAEIRRHQAKHRQNEEVLGLDLLPAELRTVWEHEDIDAQLQLDIQAGDERARVLLNTSLERRSALYH
ncbi:hypothetical protein FRC12_003326 [Ceratobasidium sp. 428]|nr:hypothetical protein FRC09_020803 [Ceratobasidium sp. 395]KAG8771933.1 hypothetical protein FRC12_003326 [Ceratobasidium sp. 428]